MRLFYAIIFVCCSLNGFAQDSLYARKVINQLTSKAYWGRGYTKNGMAMAADFIEGEFKSLGLQPLAGTNYKQEFSYPVNTFPGKMEVSINGKSLVPGKDFIVSQASKSINATGNLTQVDSSNYVSRADRIVVTTTDKLTWSVATQVADFTQILVKKSALPANPQTITTTIENQFVPTFKTANICAVVKGTAHPDSLILITAHYDHLGGMGDQTYFPGANDNASGVSFLLSLAKYYAKHPQRYSIGFVCFAGEEAGLLGSKYFTENPTVPLANIKFLFNVDLVGTGQDGATVVNATVYPKAFAKLKEINETHHYLVKIGARGKAPNSDHYFFTEKGVPAFFLYTQGGISAYHDVDDRPETLPLTVYSNLFKLFIAFNNSLME